MKVTVKPIAVGVLGTIPQRINKKEEDLESRGQLKTFPSTDGVENSQKSIIIIIIIWDFNIQTDHLISARRPDLIIINKIKENLQNCRLCCPGGPQYKSEGK